MKAIEPVPVSDLYLWTDERIQDLPTELWQTVAQLCVMEFRHGLRWGWQPPLSTMAQVFDEPVEELRDKLRKLEARGLIEREGKRFRVVDWVMFKSELPSYRRMRYGDYLRTPHWEDVRFQAIRHANWLCEQCGRSGTGVTLHVHHKTYERLGHEKPEDLMVLCDSCHREIHAEKIAWAKKTMRIDS